MAKKNTTYYCEECQAESLRWLGRCPVCSAWNSMSEKQQSLSGRNEAEKLQNKPKKWEDIDIAPVQRMIFGEDEWDRPLGGGIVPGSLILLGGDPGIGKSTLALQLCEKIGDSYSKVLYATGEESAQQIKLRANRFDSDGDNTLILAETNLEYILSHAREISPCLVVIDSIQTMHLPGNETSAGSISQIKDCTAQLLRFAKEENVAVLIVGHVTKEGNLAGPRMLEHMVDVVIYFEGERSHQFRILKTVKNRFGTTSETGIFIMSTKGLQAVENISKLILAERSRENIGTIIFPAMEGLRSILIEIQALTTRTNFGMPRRATLGYDYNRLLVLLAVMEKRGQLQLSDDDVYLNIAGGFKVNEPAADLAAMLSVASSFLDKALMPNLVVMGEVGLTGDVRRIPHVTLRIREAKKMGFSNFIVPFANKEELLPHAEYVKFHFVTNFNEALEKSLKEK